MPRTYRLLIGGIGDDSHSVGMKLLTLAFREAGFFVKNIGILNELDDFFRSAKDFDALLISCINGHADLYLKDFPDKHNQFKLANSDPKVWYLGGNLSLQHDHEGVIRKYRKMGFDYVAPKPVPWDEIKENLLMDFHRKGIRESYVGQHLLDDQPETCSLDSISDEEMDDAAFVGMRQEVLESWPTGKDVLTTDPKRTHADVKKNLHHLLMTRIKEGAKPLVHPRTGVAHLEDEIEILKFLRKHGLEVSSVQLDAASRKKMFRQAEDVVLTTMNGTKSYLNGFPVQVHGVRGIEAILQSIDTPFQIRAGSPDHRLVYEIGVAGGASSIEGGFICYLFPYDKKTPPTESLGYWKYVDKLAGEYFRKHGIIINREFFGPLTCFLVEPSIPICINIIQAILAAKSGVRSISVGLAEQGNRSQDIASIRILEKTTRRYLAKYGFPDRGISTVYHEYMAAFPTDRSKAREVILNSATTGALSGTTRIMTKTAVESIMIPTREDNAEGIRLTHEGIRKAGDTAFNNAHVQREMRLLEREVTGFMNAIEELGKGSIARGVLLAFQEGILDIPFSPSIYNRGRLMTARDSDGAVRFVNPEILPFDQDIVDYHKLRIQQRMTMERKTKIYEIIENDLTRIWKNDFKEWPLDAQYLR